MKELSIEEKAQRYDEAIERAKKLYEQGTITECLGHVFPELKESEEERIRKSLTILLQHFCNGYRVPGLDFPVSYKDMLAWVEKNPVWSEEDKEMFDYALDMIEWYDGKNKKRVRLVSNWLKSLKERYTWKPSELQIEALESATENCAYSEYQDCLRELIGQLKKLKE